MIEISSGAIKTTGKKPICSDSLFKGFRFTSKTLALFG
jgi:hypothetical protein